MEKPELQKLSVEELINLSEKDTSNFRWNRSDIYKVIFEKYKELGEEEKAEKARKEIFIFDLSTQDYPKMRFSSKISGTTDKGEKWKYPDLEKDFPGESIEYYKNRAEATNNPILKARYCDVIWELDKDIDYAVLAIEAYLNCCPIYLNNEWDGKLADSLDRSLVIALLINNQEQKDKSIGKHYEFNEQLMARKRYRYLLEIIESILKQEQKIGDKIDYAHLISTIEIAITYYAQNIPDSFHLQRSFMELLVKIWQIRKNQEESKKARIRIAESLIEEAEWKKINYPGGNIVAAHFYELAMRAYIELGDFPEKVTDLKIKIQEANASASRTEYKQISGEVEIPKESIDRYFETYDGKETKEIFQMMSLDKNLIPSYERSKKEAIEQSKQFVLQHILPVAVMKGNICVKHISEDGKIEYETIKNFQINYRVIANILLRRMFDLLEKEQTQYCELLIQYLSASGIIDKTRLEIIVHGLHSFKNKEYVAAIHVLVFQIEGILRDLLEKLGLPTFSYRNNEMRERMLTDVLATLYQVEGIDKDLLKFIEIFLCDIRGDNYRNDIAHGLLPAEAFTKENAQLLLLILIKIASYSLVKKEKANEA